MSAPSGEPQPAEHRPGEAPPAAGGRLPAAPARVLGLLTAITVVGWVDRFVVAALVESLRADLWLTDARLGWLMSGFAAVQVLALPAAGVLADRLSRIRLLALGACGVGAATLLAGAAHGFATLLALRLLAGASHAACSAPTPHLRADARERASRGLIGRALAGGSLVGAALAYAAGGIADRALGWRAAFAVAGLPALVLGLHALRVHERARGAAERPRALPWGGVAAIYRRLLDGWPPALAVLANAAHAFAAGAMAFWLPAFLERTRGVPRVVAALELAALVAMTGLAGTYAGRHLARAVRARRREADLWVSGLAALAAAPLSAAAFTTSRPAVYLSALAAALLLLFASARAARAAFAAKVAPAEREPALAVGVLASQLLGDVPAPALVGLFSDQGSLGRALLVVPAALLVAGVVWTSTAWRRERAASAGAGARDGAG